MTMMTMMRTMAWRPWMLRWTQSQARTRPPLPLPLRSGWQGGEKGEAVVHAHRQPRPHENACFCVGAATPAPLCPTSRAPPRCCRPLLLLVEEEGRAVVRLQLPPPNYPPPCPTGGTGWSSPPRLGWPVCCPTASLTWMACYVASSSHQAWQTMGVAAGTPSPLDEALSLQQRRPPMAPPTPSLQPWLPQPPSLLCTPVGPLPCNGPPLH